MNRLSSDELRNILDRYDIDIVEIDSTVIATKRGEETSPHFKIPAVYGGGGENGAYWALASLVAWVLQKESQL